MTVSEFQPTFDAWLDAIMSEDIPEETQAFSFNLYEGPWAIELIGADRYDEDDADWACDECFRPEAERLKLPTSTFGNTWEAVQENAVATVRAYLEQSKPGSVKLRESEAVAVGFVDGDLRRVWPA